LILERVPGSRFLAMTAQVDEMTSLADEYSIPGTRRLVVHVAHDQIHHWLPWIDFGLTLLVPPNRAKRASMPTKLAEFFATGVAPISHGGNAEVGEWILRTGSGLLLDDLSPRSLERAVAFVARGKLGSDRLAQARLAAADHFSLDSGARRYDALFRGILS
jgi:glycosyltransferase involved in cell wall biosynthesis